MNIEGLDLVRISSMCPEQYDVYEGNKQVAYLRVRFGHFTVDMPDAGDETVYKTAIKGDGEFESEERQEQLEKAIRIIRNKLETQ